ncbi:Mur ligase family protein [Ruficoccus sp. ZRK36]|uniref:UDP-N-acetylmuramate--L-alanine ligase n=1 Tax=Ruficoccus sp. ZRK36 TaxID=2866311 RepID=UPI001C72ECE0|nr:Mur ligase family protein [Ruficoccus sp. ZRK36]QYY34560.1 Mur ligase [Ruficoccus sp. ZRK36]
MKIYFMGICGTAMGNVAVLMKRQGHDVSGSDTGIYPPMSDLLAGAEIDVMEGFDPQRLEELAPDTVVIGNAMSRGNPEVEWLLETRKFPFVSLPELVSREILSARRNIVISGTHGKTTTTSLAAYLLEKNAARPGWMIGGVPRDLPSGCELGEAGGPFAIEGDEYDSAFFDKRSKFIHYQPRVLVMNNLEFDHGDIFRDLEDIVRSFRHLTRLVPQGGAILYNADEPTLSSLMPVPWTRCISVGVGENADCRIADFEESPEGSRFTLCWPGGARTEIAWSLPGLFNARNAAMAAVSAGLILDPLKPESIDLSALKDFQGVKRRQEVRLDRPGLTVLEDFGHHPTAIAQTLVSLRARYPEWRLTACFEPRSNTACTSRFQQAFTDALAGADEVFLAPVHRADRYAEEDRLDTVRMARALATGGIAAHACDSFDALLDSLTAATVNETAQPRCVVIFSNGAFGGKLPLYLAQV